jgi:hypothetical protein
MFRSKYFFSVLSLLVLFAGLVSADVIWVSIGAQDVNSAPVMLMKIDELGNVIQEPKAVVTDAQLGGDNVEKVTALAPGASGKLNLYMLNDNANPSDQLFLAKVDKTTLAAKVRATGFLADDSDNLQVTQGSGPRFLAILTSITSGTSLSGLPLNSKGLPVITGKFRLSPRTDGGADEFGMSSDGRVSLVVDSDPGPELLYAQPLKSNGIPTGDPIVVGSSSSNPNNGILTADSTNLLSGNRRFIAFYDADVEQLFVQVVDGTTLQKIGQRKSIHHMLPEADDQQVAIDPLGRFVLFADQDTGKCPAGFDSIFFQALDGTGSASGNPKVIANPCDFPSGSVSDFQGIDLLIDN